MTFYNKTLSRDMQAIRESAQTELTEKQMKATWIKPSDGIPPKEETVLVCYRSPSTHVHNIVRACYDEAKHAWIDDLGDDLEDIGMTIIAWTHMPEPPKDL